MIEITIPTGFSAVNDLETLTTAGSRSSRLFFAGDVIEILDAMPCSRTLTDRKTGETVVDDKGQPKLVFYVFCRVNGSEPTPVALASFRRFPRDVNAFLEQDGTELMRRLYQGTDKDRYNLLRGKTLQVSSVVPGEAIDRSVPHADGEPWVFKDSKFAVFTVKE